MTFIKGQPSWNKGKNNFWMVGSKNSNWVNGMSKTSFYGSWYNMKSRCTNPNYTNSYLWKGRGITYDPKWEKFINFYNDMFSSYKEGLSIDRMDNDKGYSKENCRWATMKEQQNNRRNNHIIEFKGIRDTLMNWSRYFGVNRRTITQRLKYGWDIETALTKGTEYGWA